MNTKSFLSGVLDVAGAFVPGVAAAAKVVNAFMDEGKQLDPAKATGKDVVQAYDSLPADSKQAIDAQLETELAQINASVDRLKEMVSAELATGNTRPEIAKMMAWAVFLAVLVVTVAWSAAIFSSNAESLAQIKDSWPLMVAILGTPTALLRSYFGLRTKEKHARYAAASGQSISDAVGGIVRLFKK